MRKLFARYVACICASVLVAMTFASSVVQAEASVVRQPGVLISEVQTGGLEASGAENGKLEFIELYSSADISVDVTGWRVEYLSASHNGAGAPTRLLATLTGMVQPRSYVLVGYEKLIAGADIFFGADSTAAGGLLARSGGHVRLVDNHGDTADLVGWGTGVAIGTWPRVAELSPGQSVQRIIMHDVPISDLSFAAPSPSPTPQGGGLSLPVDPETGMCEGLAITELLPNPEGADGGKEYIELYNPTDQPVEISGCALRLGDTGKTLQLPDEVLPPQSYRTFFDGESGLTLPNAIAVTVWLISTNSEQGILYPDGLQNNQAWAVKDGIWHRTMTPTPNAVNVISETIDGSDAELSSPPEQQNACPPGKERNPATNRCRSSMQIATSPTPCKSGTTRNPATGRCRAIPTATSLTPCKPGQQRSAETNRCRSVLTQATVPKPCPAGQERSMQTNRCRKAQTAGKQITSVQDVRIGGGGFDARWGIAAVLVTGAVGYAVYEWRQDIHHAVHKVLRRNRPKSRGG